ncbi:Ribosomal RNA small subunit methyltransferase E [Anatilimnocola aggregata]|uniref:Ribosomal RNA small subunit methyltransferase E n=1 Tax=Anatilimnocola aggregata TaxID=2528021 RepID=A0A517Y827_9BACT|nr:RsmE family RNA methyltransferase [Anatilimnocola aggregata]QDU26390.1 Ribosomal RNA small subunit methyltransferase E [Anatilimnocola aggregata]
MSERFFIEPPIVGDRALLTGSEVHHLAGVMRAKVGDEITLFDGSGCEFTGRIELLKKDRCELAIVARQEISREPAIAVIAGVALPKGDRQKWLVEKITELGVTELVPLLTTRGVVQPGEQAASRLKRSVIEASKQCGRNRLLEIGTPVRAQDWFVQVPASETRLLADPAGVPLANALSSNSPTRVYVAVGPEGGLTAEEVAAAKSAGWQSVSLGRSILRIETAAIAFAACLIGRGESAQ